ncbi:hypothetical protein SCA6_015431 [Theobroma cacao]
MPVLNLLIVALFFLPICNSRKQSSCSSLCGNLSIQYPFRLRNDPANCGDSSYELACEHERPVLTIGYGRFYVESISYDNETLHAVDPGLKTNDCSSLPRYAWTAKNLSCVSEYCNNSYYHLPYWLSLETEDTMIYLNCSTTVNSSEYLDASPCITNSSLPQAHHLYVFLGNLQAASLSNSCDYFLMTPAVIQTPGNLTYADIHKKLTIGYELSWSYSSFSSICESNGGYCPFSDGIGDSKRICCRGPLTSVNCFVHYLWIAIQGCIGLVLKIVGEFFM